MERPLTGLLAAGRVGQGGGLAAHMYVGGATEEEDGGGVGVVAFEPAARAVRRV